MPDDMELTEAWLRAFNTPKPKDLWDFTYGKKGKVLCMRLKPEYRQ